MYWPHHLNNIQAFTDYFLNQELNNLLLIIYIANDYVYVISNGFYKHHGGLILVPTW